MKQIFTRKNFLSLGLIVGIYLVVSLLRYVGIIDAYYEVTLVTICINVILAVSLNLITGFTGQFSLGHAGFMAVGAYTAALITKSLDNPYAYIIGILAGALLAALIGILIGIPTLRLRGDYLAIATLGMGEIIRILLLNIGITGGASGLDNIPEFTTWPLLFFLTVITVVVINNFIKSSPGRACIAVREDEIAAEAMGVNTTRSKIVAFTLGAFFAGIAGALYSGYFYFIKPDISSFLKSIDILVIVVLGGMGSIPGSIVAAIVLAFVSMLLQDLAEVRMIIYSLLLIVLMIMKAKGFRGPQDLIAKWRGKKTEKVV